MKKKESESGGFPETADIETSSDAYASRFAGATGAWLLQVQERIVLSKLKERGSVTVLDVGGGHGQLTIPLCREKFQVTVMGSSEKCRARIADLADSGQCGFEVGNVIALPFEDKSFDTVICFRLVTHCTRWTQLIKELCRVARYSVIVDYPTTRSLNKIAPLLFRAKKSLEGNTRTWTMFRDREIYQEFGGHGFSMDSRSGQFFVPMVLHRALRCRRLSVALEAVSGLLGLSKLWGSPVIVEMVRKAGPGALRGCT
ncbi:class I SAM-dependent methyltransferase [Verrucomicrobiota bacterium]